MWQFSLPFEGKRGRMPVLVDAFFGNGMTCSSTYLLPLLLFIGNYRFVSDYSNSPHWEINISYMQLCGGSSISLQHASPFCPDCSSHKAEVKCHAPPILLPKVSREQRCVFLHLTSEKHYGRDLQAGNSTVPCLESGCSRQKGSQEAGPVATRRQCLMPAEGLCNISKGAEGTDV